MRSRRKARPLSGRGAEIELESDGPLLQVWWGATGFVVPGTLIRDVLEDYFGDGDHWKPLGAGMTEPTVGGLGEFVRDRSALTPRHASALAAILVADGRLESRRQRPIELRKVK